MEEGARSDSKGIADVGWLPAGVPLPVTICQTNRLRPWWQPNNKYTSTHLSVNFQLAFEPLSRHVNLFAFAGQSEWESVT